MNDNQIHTGADDLTHQAMEEALHRRNTAEIRRLLEAGFLLSNAPRTPDGYEQPHYYLKELINYYCFYSHYKELIELLPLFLDRSESLSSLELESIGRIHANEYTKDILRLLIDHVEDINEQNRSGNSILHEKLKDYQNTYAYQSGPDEIVPPEKNEPDIILDLLLERSDLDVNLMNYSDLSPLYYACRQTTARIVRKLLEKGADPYVLYGKKGNTLLHEACDNNKMQVIPLLVTFGVDVNEANALSQTPLHIVCKKQYPEIIQYLLQNGADPMRQDKDGNTPLHLLVKETKPQTIDCIDLLLDNGADINAVNDLQRTPFFVCAQTTDNQFRNRNGILLNHLLEKGAYADTSDINQNNPLYHAVEDDDLERVNLLLKAGVDPNCRNRNNISPYKLALQKNRRSIISRIEKSQVKITADPDDLDAAFLEACANGKRGVAEMLFKSGNIDITYVDDSGRTPLHYIAKAGMIALAGYVLDKGVDINYTDKYEQTALHIATAFRQKEMAKLLLARGANGAIRDDKGLLPIHYIAQSGQSDLLKAMQHSGYDLEAATDRVDTPLHIAAFHRAKENVRVLLEAEVAPDPQNNLGITPLQLAVQSSQKEIVKLLVEHGSDISRTDTDGDAPIHWASGRGNKEMVRQLLELGADINALNNRHQTALHIAIIRRDKNLVNYLLESGADLEIKTAEGNSCIDLAVTSGQKELIELIGIIQRRREALAD